MRFDDPRAWAAKALDWAADAGASIVSTDDGDALRVTPDPPSVVAFALTDSAARCYVGAWLDDAAERWPDAWARGNERVRTWLAARSCARIAFTGPQHHDHDRHTALRRDDGHPPELSDLLAVGDVIRADGLVLAPSLTPTAHAA